MEPKEFEILAKRLRGRLTGLAGKFISASGAHFNPEDIVQEAFLTLWKLNRDNYPIRNPEALAVRLTKTICVSKYRKYRIKTVDMSGRDFDGGKEASELTDSRDLRLLMDRIYSSLTETQRQFLQMKNDENLSLDEIAAITGKPKSSVKTTISAARRKMLDLIKQDL